MAHCVLMRILSGVFSGAEFPRGSRVPMLRCTSGYKIGSRHFMLLLATCIILDVFSMTILLLKWFQIVFGCSEFNALSIGCIYMDEWKRNPPSPDCNNKPFLFLFSSFHPQNIICVLFRQRFLLQQALRLRPDDRRTQSFCAKWVFRSDTHFRPLFTYKSIVKMNNSGQA